MLVIASSTLLPARLQTARSRLAFFGAVPYHRSFNSFGEFLMGLHIVRRFAFISILVLSAVSFGQQAAPASEAPKDTITRIFSGEFRERLSAPPRWFDGGQSYIETEAAAGEHGHDVVRYDTATGKKRDVLITAAQLTPAGAKQPVEIAALSWSKDNQRVLIFTNTRRVWRTNSRGDYWFLDR